MARLGLLLLFALAVLTSTDARAQPEPKAASALARPARAKKPRLRVYPDWRSHPSARYAALSAAECRAELGHRGIAFTPVTEARGVLAPVRLPEGVGGVVYRTEVPERRRADNPFDVFDCRLVLALSDFSRILQAHDIDEVLIFSAWRPPSRRAGGEGKPLTRHPGGLAIDAFRFAKRPSPGETKKTWLDVKRDFAGKLGAPVCEGGAPHRPGASAATRELRSIVCETDDAHVFTAILTPNYDRAHKNHLHLEVTPGVEWSLLR